MMRYFFLYFGLLLPAVFLGQGLTGLELLDKAIEYHDPKDSWSTFEGRLSIKMSMPNGSERMSDIIIKLPQEYFHLTTIKDRDTISQELNKGVCELSLNGSTDLSEEDITKHRLTCERTTVMKDYYTYLYGLPMKLKDPGTVIDSKVQTKTFKNKEYLVLKASYMPEAGKDTWYFYFDPKTFALKAYQFYHNEATNDGEYIILSGEEEVGNIKIPKTRAWYYNIDDKYLATDILTKGSSL